MVWYEPKYIRRFGCVAYLHVPPQRRKSKLESRAKKGVFVGYGLGTAGFRIWLPEEERVYESKHVTFDEKHLAYEKGHRISNSFEDDDIPASQTEVAPQTRAHSPLPGPSTKPDRVTEVEEYEEDTDGVVTISQDPGMTQICLPLLDRSRQGKTKGKVDIYLYTPEGRVLRSKRETAEYCKKHRVIIRVDQLKELFSIRNKFRGPVEFPKVPPHDSESETSEYEDPEEAIGESHCTEVIIPRTPTEAYRLPQAKKWKEAMREELVTMEERQVWTPTPKPESGRIIGTKWVYTLKEKANHQLRYKARLVALGHRQQEGLDYDEIYSPVINFALIRLFVALFICALGWCHSLLDVKCAYLYGNIDRDIYIRKPAGYFLNGKK